MVDGLAPKVSFQSNVKSPSPSRKAHCKSGSGNELAAVTSIDIVANVIAGAGQKSS